MSKIIDCIKNYVAENNNDYRVYENYSGRCMFGETCLGVVIKEGSSYMNFLIKLTQYFEESDIDDANFDLEGVSVDSLGKDTIVYFPNIRG